MKRLLVSAVMLTGLVALSTAGLALSWQTEPIMGTGVTSITGDVVVITGPAPTKPDGSFYYDVDGNKVLGPTIPHYSIPGDPLYQVGSPSMTEFWINPNVFENGHWTDKTARIAHGSGINVTQGTVYTWTADWYFLGTPGNDPYHVTDTAAYTATESFVMLQGSLVDLWAEDVGKWRYTETWTDGTNTICSVRDFDVKAVPEPMSIFLGIMGLGSVAGFRRLRKS